MIDLRKKGKVVSIHSPGGGNDNPLTGIEIYMEGSMKKAVEVPAMVGGTVAHASYTQPWGNTVVVRQDDGFIVRYANLSSVVRYKKDAVIKEGDIIGTMKGANALKIYIQTKEDYAVKPNVYFKYYEAGATDVLKNYEVNEIIGNEHALRLDWTGEYRKNAYSTTGYVMRFVVCFLLALAGVNMFFKAFGIKLNLSKLLM